MVRSPFMEDRDRPLCTILLKRLPDGRTQLWLYNPKSGRRSPASEPLWPSQVDATVAVVKRQLLRAGDRVQTAEA
jgi:hypothetical protein